MDYCGPQGIPWLGFLGWDRLSREAAIEWARVRADTCTCGTRLEEWDPERGGHPAAYVATVRDCKGCAAIARRETRLRKEIESGEAGPGAKVVLKLQRPMEITLGGSGADPGHWTR
jgi:hypothetical protein